MKKLTLVGLVLFGLGFTLNAQNYNTGVGLRGGTANGLTIKHYVSPSTALEAIFASRWNGVLITGLVEIDNEFNTPGLNWFYGAGAHIGFWDGASWWIDGETTSPIIGIDAILGIEYTFEDLPISLTLDWKPAINLIGFTGAWTDSGAFSIRYVF
ncbi:MAG: hypothetical protein GY834_05640 [Bacteroidetes bacterium]|nr:hypothetical protein [Bacteroidota bacterium]